MGFADGDGQLDKTPGCETTGMPPRKSAGTQPTATPPLKAQAGGSGTRTPTSAFDAAAGKDIYEPNKIIAHRLAKGVTQYQVRWKCYMYKDNEDWQHARAGPPEVGQGFDVGALALRGVQHGLDRGKMRWDGERQLGARRVDEGSALRRGGGVRPATCARGSVTQYVLLTAC